MLAVLRRRNFCLLWVGGLVSGLGDWFLFIALPFYVYDLTGSTLATGAMFIAETLPSILFGSIAGVFVDRWDRRLTMVASDLSRAVVLLFVLLARTPDTVWIIYVVSFVDSSIGQFFGPARSALIPRLVDEEDLVAANSLDSIGQELTRLVGPVLGGAAMGLFGLASVVLGDAGSFAFSAAMVALIATAPVASGQESSRRSVGSPLLRTVWGEFAQGLVLIRRGRLVRALLLVAGTFMIGQGIINVLLIPFIKDVLHGDALVLGWVASAQGVGGLLGGLLIGQSARALPPARLVAVGLLLTGVLLTILVNLTWLPLVLGLVAMIGVAAVAFGVGDQTLLQSAVEDRYRGRVFGAFRTVQSTLLLAGMGFAGALGGLAGTVPMLDVAGALGVIAGAIAWVGLVGAARAGKTSLMTEADALEAEVG